MERWVFFDLDGTLTRSEEGIWNCVRYAAERMGFPEPDGATLAKFIGPPLVYSFQEYMGMTADQAVRAQEVYRERYNTVGKYENRVYPGVRALLRTLRSQGVRMGVVTGKPENSTRDILDYFGLSRFFERISCAADNRAEKEHLLRAVMPLVSPQAAAMLRTTAAFTMASGSDACNVLPQEASVWANLRFIPHQGKEASLRALRRRAGKYGLDVEVISAVDPSGSVDIRGEAWGRVMDAIGECFPGLPASPYVVTGGTDARFYQEICPSCVRFGPVVYDPEQMKGMHGLNENIGAACLPGAVDFYKTLIRKNRH